MEKPKTPIYNPEDLKALPVGACPYCGGKATVTLNQKKEYTSLRDYPAGFFIYGCNVKCENGCDLVHFYIPHDGDECSRHAMRVRNDYLGKKIAPRLCDRCKGYTGE